MIDYNKIFKIENTVKCTNIMELLMALVDSSNSIADKRNLWNKWQTEYYSTDDVMSFFSDSLFSDGGLRFFDIICHTDYKNFYEMACSLDLAGFDPKAYYLYWILGYGHKEKTQLVKDALEYDPDVIKGMFPDIEQVIMNEEI